MAPHRWLSVLAVTAASIRPERIPVLDLKALRTPEQVAALGRACAEPGFFHVINHGVPTEVIAAFERATRAFFALPADVKRRVKRTATNSRGYADDEFTKRTRDYKQLYDYGHTPRPDLPSDAPENRVMDGHNQLPDLPGFREAVEAYYACCAEVCDELLDAVARSLDVAPEAFRKLFAGGHTSYLRLNAYPAAKDRHVQSDVNLDADRLVNGAEDLSETPLDKLEGPRLGVNRHFDAGVLTLLYQDHSISSLQVNLNAHRSGPPHWIDVAPVENALTVNVGDMLQVLSNGRYRAPEHRVLASPPGVSRVSAPFFYNPAYAAEICGPCRRKGQRSSHETRTRATGRARPSASGGPSPMRGRCTPPSPGATFESGASRATSPTRGGRRSRSRTSCFLWMATRRLRSAHLC
jgi:isopenicillin N synthase-like dioxygenase